MTDKNFEADYRPKLMNVGLWAADGAGDPLIDVQLAHKVKKACQNKYPVVIEVLHHPKIGIASYARDSDDFKPLENQSVDNGKWEAKIYNNESGETLPSVFGDTEAKAVLNAVISVVDASGK